MRDSDGPTPPPRPRGELFADPSAAPVWAAIEELPENLKRELYARLTAHLEVTTDDRSPRQARAARGVQALRDAYELLQQQPRSSTAFGALPPHGEPRLLTQHAYRALYDEHGKRLSWPPESTLRTWLGGTWNDCL